MSPKNKTRKPRKRVFVHIGVGKTDTTALQTFLTQQADAIERQGISYPFREAPETVAAGKCSGNLVHVMASHATRNRRPADIETLIAHYLPRVIDEAIDASRKDTVVLSSEAIAQTTSPEIVAYLQDLSSRHHVTLLGFVRDPYDHMQSSWKQRVKQGHCQSLPKHIDLD